MRPLSAAAKKAIFAQETAEVFLCLLTISNVGLSEPLRFVNDTRDLVSRGETFLGCPFQITLPDESDQPPKAMLAIDNVAQEIVAAVRSLVTPPLITLEVVLASSPDTVEAGPFAFTLRGAQYDVQVVSGTLVFEDMLNEAFPAAVFSPATAPGLF